ncbi:MAG TPA: type VI secretion system-associated protein TagF [Anaeromyxobacter sp.]
MTAPSPIGFFGKIPAQGDFVRANVGDALVQRFTRWLEEASEACHRTRAQVPRQPVRFLFRAAGEARALVGALRGSQDRVGRQFPLAAFAPIQGRFAEKDFPAAPIAYAGLFSALSEAIEADPASPAALSEKLGAIRVSADEAGVDEAVRAAAARPARELLGLLGEASSGRRHYALNTLLAACAPLRGREPAKAETVLDCPVASDADAFTWLELARRALGWSGAPAFFLRAGAPGRLLLSLGSPPAAVLPSLAEPRKESPKIWPLETSVASAIEAARKALGPARAAALERDEASVGDLATQVAGGGA